MKKIASWFCFILLLVSATADAQFRRRSVAKTSNPTISDTVNVSVKLEQRMISCFIGTNTHVMRSGIVSNQKGDPVPFATVKVHGTSIGTMADSSGRYSISFPHTTKGALEFSSVGFEQKTVALNNEQDATDTVVLKEINPVYSSVEITGPSRRRRGCGMCRIYVIRKRLVVDSVKKEETDITVFPNPAPKGSAVSISTTGIESPYFSLFDNQSKSIHVANDLSTAKNKTHQLSLPAYLAAGIYYIVVTDSKTKKRYTRKLIIQ